jgi:2-polyprenyl-6-methoxyphenol hydroxylase-like FAD-dependent oxidoreductase
VTETMLRGFYRRASGPGWALVGDAGHFKHPATAQGICDAVEQALYIAEDLSAGGSLGGYEAWRDERAKEHYEWSFRWGYFPKEEVTGPIFRGLAGDEWAGRDLRDSFSRLVEPSQVLSPERLSRWFAASAPVG